MLNILAATSFSSCGVSRCMLCVYVWTQKWRRSLVSGRFWKEEEAEEELAPSEEVWRWWRTRQTDWKVLKERRERQKWLQCIFDLNPKSTGPLKMAIRDQCCVAPCDSGGSDDSLITHAACSSEMKALSLSLSLSRQPLSALVCGATFGCAIK